MTFSIQNTTYDTCSICQEDFTNIEKKDTKKVIELACNHFFHMECLASWFSHNENNMQDLFCGYCTQISIQRNQPRISFTREDLRTFFEEIKHDPISQSDHDVIACVIKLNSLLEPLFNLLNDIHFTDEENSVSESANKVIDWIKANIGEEHQGMTARILTEIYKGSNVVRTLGSRVKHLANIPYDKWPIEIQEFGVPVHHSVGDKKFRVRVSKRYLEAEVTSYLSKRIQDLKLFESNLEQVQMDYYYDDEVLEAIPHTKNLQKGFSQLLENNPISSVEEMLSLLEETINKIEIKDDLKETVRLIMNKFLFRRGALRTLTQEINRWKKESITRLPPIIRFKGVRVLDEDDVTKDYFVENFKELMSSYSPKKRDIDLTKPFLITLTVGLVAKWVFNRLST